MQAESLRLPPQSLEAEQALLGAVFHEPLAVPRVIETRLEPDDFYREANGLIFKAMRHLFDQGEPVDLLTVSETLKKDGALEKIGGPAYLVELSDAVATAANVTHYAGIVRDKSTLRRLMSTASHIAEQAQAGGDEVNQILDTAEASIMNIRDGRDFQSLTLVQDLLNGTIGRVEAATKKSGGVTGVPSGFADLDRMTGGLQPSDLIILAGRPSMGKTAFALNLATQTALPEERDHKGGEPYSIVFFSLEMSKDQLMLRLLCSIGGLNLMDVRTGRMKEQDMIRLTDAATRLFDALIWIDDTPALSVMEMRAKARRLKSQLDRQGQSLGLVIVDYLQLMRGSGSTDSREQEISEISRSLKALAKELDVPVLALSQLNRSLEARNDKRPILSDLRESGAIEQDADLIAFVFREEVYKPENEELKGKAEIIIGKQRNGPIGKITMAFENYSARFRSFMDNRYD